MSQKQIRFFTANGQDSHLDGKRRDAQAGAAQRVTFKATVAVCVLPPPAPVTVIVYVPVAVFEATAMVMVEAPAGAAMEVGLKVTVTPVG